MLEVELEFTAMQETEVSHSQEKQRAFKKATPESLAQGNAYLKFEKMVKQAEHKILRSQLQATMQSSPSSAEALLFDSLFKHGSILSEQELSRIYQQSGCSITTPAQTKCKSVKYRSQDGTCNNLDHPTWGAANTPLRRLLPASYEDGVHEQTKGI